VIPGNLAQMLNDSDLRKAFGGRIKTLRKQRGWTQKELAAKLDVRFAQLNKYESGLHVPPIEKLLALAEVFNTTIDYLVTGNETDDRPLHNTRLLERFKAATHFDAESQETVINLIDAMIVKQRATGLLVPVDEKP